MLLSIPFYAKCSIDSFFVFSFSFFSSKIFSVISFLDPFFGVLKNNLLQVKQNQKWQNHGGFAKGLL